MDYINYYYSLQDHSKLLYLFMPLKIQSHRRHSSLAKNKNWINFFCNTHKY